MACSLFTTIIWHYFNLEPNNWQKFLLHHLHDVINDSSLWLYWLSSELRCCTGNALRCSSYIACDDLMYGVNLVNLHLPIAEGEVANKPSPKWPCNRHSSPERGQHRKTSLHSPHGFQSGFGPGTADSNRHENKCRPGVILLSTALFRQESECTCMLAC